MKYRIVKKEFFELTLNHDNIIDYVPKKEWITSYVIESKQSFFSNWNVEKVFTSEAQALVHLEYLQQKPKITIIKK